MHVKDGVETVTPVSEAESWTVVDSTDQVVCRVGSRGEAVRVLGRLAVLGHSLPLRVLTPQGVATGDQLG